MHKIAILDDYQGLALSMADWAALAAAHRIRVFDAPLGDLEATAAALQEFSIVCAMRERTRFPRELLQRLPALRLLVTTGHRNAAIDTQAAKELGVTVCGTRSSPHAASELTWALIMALARGIPWEHERMRRGAWQPGLGRDLRGLALGVLGLGRHGARVAGYGRAFGMRVMAWSQNLSAERARECGAELLDKEELLRSADVLTIHLRLSERTRGLIGARELRLLKPTALLVNTSRGPIVEEAALIAALREQRIAGAALDVFDSEPLPPAHPLRDCPNTVLTPHVGYVTEQNYRAYYTDTVECIEAFLAGQPVRVIQ